MCHGINYRHEFLFFLGSNESTYWCLVLSHRFTRGGTPDPGAPDVWSLVGLKPQLVWGSTRGVKMDIFQVPDMYLKFKKSIYFCGKVHFIGCTVFWFSVPRIVIFNFGNNFERDATKVNLCATPLTGQQIKLFESLKVWRTENERPNKNKPIAECGDSPKVAWKVPHCKNRRPWNFLFKMDILKRQVPCLTVPTLPEVWGSQWFLGATEVEFPLSFGIATHNIQ